MKGANLFLWVTASKNNMQFSLLDLGIKDTCDGMNFITSPTSPN